MNGCSAGIYDSDLGVISEEILEISRGQAEYLMPMIDKVVKFNGGDYSDLDLIAVINGPGAFTGIRIGIATAKSLALVLEIPVIGVCTFSAVLETYLSLNSKPNYDYYGVLLETKRQDYYFRMFDNKTFKPCSGKIVASAQDILNLIADKNCILLGDASKRFMQEVSCTLSFNVYDIYMSSPLSIAKNISKDYTDYSIDSDCSAIYLRPPEVGVSKTILRKLKG